MPLVDRIAATVAGLSAVLAFALVWAWLVGVLGVIGLLLGWAPAAFVAALAFEAVAALCIQITESIR
jgi:hypothetical protein